MDQGSELSEPAKAFVKPRWAALIPVRDFGLSGPYEVAIIDPPWPHANYSKTKSGKSPKYEMVGFDELRSYGRTINGLLAKDAVVWVWATATHLSNAMTVVADWGLEYRTYRVWTKKGQSTGHWVRSNAEIALLCTKGKPRAPVRGKQGRTTFEGIRWSKIHSAKPPELHEWCETHYPDKQKLELFARTTRPGWECLGYDLGYSITAEGVVSCHFQ